MKNSHTILHIIYGFAIVILFIFTLQNKKNNESDNQKNITTASTLDTTAAEIKSEEFPIAYIIVDSLMHSYAYYQMIETNYQAIVRKETNSLQQKSQAFEKDVYELQMQMQQGLITTKNAQAKEQELQARQQKLMELQQSKQMELAQKEQQLMVELLDSVQTAIRIHNKDNKYEIVLNNAFNSSVLYAKDYLNITDAILTIMNTRYEASKNKK